MDSLLSDFDSLSESSSSDDQEDIDSLYGGQARTIFSNLEETIEKIDDFLLFERGFLHGDIVSLVSDPSGRIGKVVNVDMTVDLENIYGCKIRNVCSKNLQKIRSVSVGDYVVLGAWLGKVEKLVDRMTILFDDGTKCELKADGPEKIVSLSPDLIEDPPYTFYPGQRVQIESSLSRSTHWLCGIRKDKQEKGTVYSVDAGFVYIDWLCCAITNGEKGPTPPCVQDSKNLTVLSSYPYANWQLGDWAVLPVEQSLPFKWHKQSEMLTQSGDHSPSFQQIAVISKTKTRVDVLWQDGNHSLALDSNVLFPVNIVDAHDFWPDALVLEKGTVDDDSRVSGVQKWGVVRSVDPKERTVKVKWCNYSLDLIDSEKEQMEEIVSAYELVEHPDYSFCLGEAVFRTDKIIADHADGDFLEKHRNSKIYTGKEADLKTVENSGDQPDYLNNDFLSYYGTVVGFKHGDVEVKWATGAKSKVAPYEIYRVGKFEGASASVLSDENIQPPIDELPAKNQFSGQKLNDVLDLNNDSAKEYSFGSISQVAVGVFATITSNLFGSLSTSLISGYRCTSVVGTIHDKPPEAEEALELSNLNVDGQPQVVDDLEIPANITSLHIKEAANEDTMLQSSSELPETFRQFDMVNDCSDHHFVKESGTDLQSQVKRSWLKKVHQEWSILEKDLPETIYIRVYEERMDLLRAAIVGSGGTPYHDGLFFFDIYLPPQYPNAPPMVYYHSGGLRINPNLYESGKVCLSLLNTWTGSGSEVWDPESSTILQVLLSLQALVLNEKPYFNEAGYDTQVGRAEGEKNSFSYNENAFLVSCRSMLYLLRKPPQNFEALVEEHFNVRGRSILLACKAYLQGAPIGYPFDYSKLEQETQHGTSSTGFKIMLTKLYSRLVEAFSDKGIDCPGLLDQVP